MRRRIQWSPLGFGSVHGHTEDLQRDSDAHPGAAHLGMAASPCLSCKGSWGAPEKPENPEKPGAPQCDQCCCFPMQDTLLSPTPHALHCSPIFHPWNIPAHVCLYLKLPPFLLIFFCFKMEKKYISPFPVPPCHAPKVPTNLRCPACTQAPLIAPAFSSGVSSAIATAAPPPSGNSHLHYHSLLQSRPQAPGSEQQLR